MAALRKLLQRGVMEKQVEMAEQVGGFVAVLRMMKVRNVRYERGFLPLQWS